ncbi:MAG: oligosaccharide repeat unit polymerase [Comamonadaceae bacterium]|jgi:oligosaccharide repeat unit polymerase|nr:oligosaccharide repeat unit polymerase [Comamonadaceae bacterium]
MVYDFALFCALILAGLAYASVRLTGRADGPATLLCGIWALVLTLYWLAGDLFYPVDFATIILLTLAPAAFFIGSMASIRPSAPGNSAPAQGNGYLRAGVILWVLILLACLPAYFEHFAGEVSEDSQINFIAAIRLATLQNEGEVTDFSPLKNLQPFAYALPLVSLVAFQGQKVKGTLITLVALLLAICYGLLTGSKSVVPSLAVSFCVVLVAKNGGRLRGSGTLPILAGGVLGFLALIRYVNYTYAEDINEWDLWVAAVQGITSYLCAPIAGLNFYLNSPELFDLYPTHLSRPLYYMANSLLHLIGQPPLMELPSIHLQFFDPGASYRDQDYNTYTYLGSYIESTSPYLFLIIPLGLGMLMARLHRPARPDNIFALLLYAYVARALALSFGGELLVMDFANIIKFAVVVWIMTSLTPGLLARLRSGFRLPRATRPA